MIFTSNMDVEEKFDMIKKTYKLGETELLDKGQNLFWTTDKGIFGTSRMDVVFEFFKESMSCKPEATFRC